MRQLSEGFDVLTGFVIHRYLTCHQLELASLQPMVALIGRNGAGKTNILKAIEWAATTALQTRLVDRFPLYGMSLEIRLDPHTYRYTIGWDRRARPTTREGEKEGAGPTLNESVELQTPEGWKPVVKNQGNRLELNGDVLDWVAGLPALGVLRGQEAGNQVHSEHVAKVADFLARVRYYPLDETSVSREQRPYIEQRSYERWKERATESNDWGDSVQMRLLHLSLTRPEKLREINDILGPEGLDLLKEIEVEELRAGPIRKDKQDNQATLFEDEATPDPRNVVGYRVVFSSAGRSDGVADRLKFRDLSLGTRRIVRMVVSLIHDDSSVLLIEHPEDGIHRGLLHKVIGLLRTYTEPAQVIIASHSSVVLDDLRDDPSAVRLIMMEEGQTRARALSDAEVERAKKYINEDGAFSDFLQSRFDI